MFRKKGQASGRGLFSCGAPAPTHAHTLGTAERVDVRVALGSATLQRRTEPPILGTLIPEIRHFSVRPFHTPKPKEISLFLIHGYAMGV